MKCLGLPANGGGGVRQSGLEYFLHVGGDRLAGTQPVPPRQAKQYWGVSADAPKPTLLASRSRSLAPAQWPPAAWRSAGGPRRTTRIACVPVFVVSDRDPATGDWPQTWLRQNRSGFGSLRGAVVAGIHDHLVLAAVAYLFVMVIYLRSKKTSGVTWERVLHALQPWLVRLLERCPCCKTKFARKFHDPT